MLSFKSLSEKKTKVTINPKLKDVMEKHGGKPCPKTGEAECKCDEKTPAQKSICPTCRGKGTVDGEPCPTCKGTGKRVYQEAKKKDDTYLEPDFKKRQKNNEKARKDLMKGPQMKNPHFESTEENAYVSQEEVSEESTKEVAETETSLLTFKQFNEGRAEDAKKSLDAVKKRQKVLDAHEKKTGKKLDINKSVEARDHKKNFPGAKRTGKKVKGAKETPQETQNRRINKSTARIVKHGYTSKEKKEVDSMAKHASRFD